MPRRREKAPRIPKLQWNDERSRLIILASVCGVLLLTALLLPLAFRTDGGDAPETIVSGAPGAEERARLFVTYWYGDEAERGGLTVTRPEEDDVVMTSFCAETMRYLTDYCVNDKGLRDYSPTGSEYTTLTAKSGASVTLCRTWMQAQGDWQNWLDVCFDAESGVVYYLYLNRECLTNLSQYSTARRESAEGYAQWLAGLSGGRLRYFAPEDKGGVAVIEVGGGTLCYRIDETSYDALIDLRINCV